MQLNISNLSKSYPNGVQALCNISLTIYQGMFGLLGPNGAGKSTLMRILATLQEADHGSITLGDIDVLKEKESVRKILGYLPQEFGLYPKVTAERLLSHIGYLKGIVDKTERKEIVEALLQRTNLWSARKKQLGTFSGGMKQRFGIAQALLANPKLIIVDEPTAGLDPGERNRFLNLLTEIGEQTIVILSTHIVEDVKQLCSQMAIISNGHLLFNGRTTDALREFKGRIWFKRIRKEELIDYRKRYSVVSERLQGGERLIHVLDDLLPDDSFSPIDVGLEDVYFAQMLQAGNTKPN